MSTLKDQLARYDDEHELLRQCVVPEEDRAKYTSAKWAGEYRWFIPNLKSADSRGIHKSAVK
jgi:hypothetical protein